MPLPPSRDDAKSVAPDPTGLSAPPAKPAGLEQKLHRAEISVMRRLGMRSRFWLRLLVRALVGGAILGYFMFCVVLLTTRYLLLPHVDDWTPQIERLAGRALHATVHIAHIDGSWQGLNPRLGLKQLSVTDSAGMTVLSLPQVDVVVSWTSLLRGKPMARAIAIEAPQLSVRRRRDHLLDIAGFTIDPNARRDDSPFVDWILAQGSVRIQHAKVQVIDELAGPQAHGADETVRDPATPMTYDLNQVNFLLTRQLTGHRFSLQAQPPAYLTAAIDIRGQFSHPWLASATEISKWSGHIFLQVDQADLANLQSLIPVLDSGASLRRATGNTRLWMDFSQGHIDSLEADLALGDVDARWRPDLQDMRLDHAQGRVTLKRSLRSDGTEDQSLALSQFTLDGPNGLHLSPSHLRWSGRGNTQTFEADSLVLAEWGALARQVPLPANWIDWVDRTKASGRLEHVQGQWDNSQTPPQTFTLHGDFSDLGFAVASSAEKTAEPSQFNHLSGHLELTQDGGALRLGSNDVDAKVPFLWANTTQHFAVVETQLRWQQDAGSSPAPNRPTHVAVESMWLSNADLDVRAQGAITLGENGLAPRLDLSGSIARAQVRRVASYLPLSLPADTLAWLRNALVDGQANNGSFSVVGDASRFPFVRGQDGNFSVSLNLHGAELNPALETPGSQETTWPHLKDIEARLRFERDTFSIDATHARALGYDISSAHVQIPHLMNHDAHLLVDGQASGPLAELLKYAGNSPVNAWTGNWMHDARATGSSRFALKVDLPLAHGVDSKVSGQVVLHDNTLMVLPGLPPFADVNGTIGFSEKGVHFDHVTTGFIGGNAVVNGFTKDDGTVVFSATGSATAGGVRPLLPAGLVRRLTDQVKGQTRYQANVTIHDNNVGLKVDSDLLGLSSALPTPLNKTASEPRAFKLQLTPEPGKTPRSTLHVQWNKDLDVLLHQVIAPNGDTSIDRGVVALGQSAVPVEPGLVVLIDQPKIDVDRWIDLLYPNLASGNTGVRSLGAAHDSDDGASVMPLRHLVARGKTVVVGHRSFTNVMLNARRQSNGAWGAQLDSDEASGSLTWDGATSTQGRLSAHLIQLKLPDASNVVKGLASTSTGLVRDYPDLDITIDQFALGKSNLGHLELLAHAVGNASDHAWNLQKLRVSNPDGVINAVGNWRATPSGGNRVVSFDLDVNGNNFGNLMERLGWHGYISNGQGKLTANVTWLGEPTSPDLASLSGKVHLDAHNGVVTRLDAGAGRLLAILSFQSFWHLITGDLREFSSGVAFDSVYDDATITRGVVTTDNFLMKGNSGAGRIQGKLDLLHETQDLQVVVTPQVSATGASLAWAAFVNPAIGLGALLGNFILNKPLEAILTREYHVTGTWSEPKIESGSGPASGNKATP